MVKSIFSAVWVLMALGGDLSQAQSVPSDRVTCESIAERWQQCALPAEGEAVLLRQLSRNACVRNHSWGQDDGGVWVSRGCRAEFAVLGHGNEAAPAQAMPWRRIRCESRNGTQVDCPVNTQHGVRLVRQLATPECTLGRSWGFDDARIWVSRGCRAEFEVRSPGKRRMWQRLRDAETGIGQHVRCESHEGQRQECRVAGVKRVDLVQQLSRAECLEGQNWGWDADMIWVDAGCRAEFMMW